MGKYLDLFKGTINDQLITPNFKINLALEDDDEEEMFIIQKRVKFLEDSYDLLRRKNDQLFEPLENGLV